MGAGKGDQRSVLVRDMRLSVPEQPQLTLEMPGGVTVPRAMFWHIPRDVHAWHSQQSRPLQTPIEDCCCCRSEFAQHAVILLLWHQRNAEPLQQCGDLALDRSPHSAHWAVSYSTPHTGHHAEHRALCMHAKSRERSGMPWCTWWLQRCRQSASSGWRRQRGASWTLPGAQR